MTQSRHELLLQRRAVLQRKLEKIQTIESKILEKMAAKAHPSPSLAETADWRPLLSFLQSSGRDIASNLTEIALNYPWIHSYVKSTASAFEHSLKQLAFVEQHVLHWITAHNDALAFSINTEYTDILINFIDSAHLFALCTRSSSLSGTVACIFRCDSISGIQQIYEEVLDMQIPQKLTKVYQSKTMCCFESDKVAATIDYHGLSVRILACDDNKKRPFQLLTNVTNGFPWKLYIDTNENLLDVFDCDGTSIGKVLWTCNNEEIRFGFEGESLVFLGASDIRPWIFDSILPNFVATRLRRLPGVLRSKCPVPMIAVVGACYAGHSPVTFESILYLVAINVHDKKSVILQKYDVGTR